MLCQSCKPLNRLPGGCLQQQLLPTCMCSACHAKPSTAKYVADCSSSSTPTLPFSACLTKLLAAHLLAACPAAGPAARGCNWGASGRGARNGQGSAAQGRGPRGNSRAVLTEDFDDEEMEELRNEIEDDEHAGGEHSCLTLGGWVCHPQDYIVEQCYSSDLLLACCMVQGLSASATGCTAGLWRCSCLAWLVDLGRHNDW